MCQIIYWFFFQYYFFVLFLFWGGLTKIVHGKPQYQMRLFSVFFTTNTTKKIYIIISGALTR